MNETKLLSDILHLQRAVLDLHNEISKISKRLTRLEKSVDTDAVHVSFRAEMTQEQLEIIAKLLNANTRTQLQQWVSEYVEKRKNA